MESVEESNGAHALGEHAELESALADVHVHHEEDCSHRKCAAAVLVLLHVHENECSYALVAVSLVYATTALELALGAKRVVHAVHLDAVHVVKDDHGQASAHW